MTKTLLVGLFGPGALENSYLRAFSEVGTEPHTFDIGAAERRYCRLGLLGRHFNRFVPVEPWIRKANRELFLKVRELEPEILVVFGQSRVRVGTLAQLKAAMPVRTVLIWQDALPFMDVQTATALPLFDLVATYARSSVEVLTRLGAKRVEWVPLAADPCQHGPAGAGDDPLPAPDADVSFIGQWRPERELAITTLLAARPDLRVRIWGPDWGRRCAGNSRVVAAWQRRPLFGAEFAQAIRRSRLSLNVIDDTNYPAANMRFFEIPCAGGVQVSSPCPEMADVFKDGETVFYYSTPAELPKVVARVLDDPAVAELVRSNGHRTVLAEHTYARRAASILTSLAQDSRWT
jgi:spore maturation protein CgeB